MSDNSSPQWKRWQPQELDLPDSPVIEALPLPAAAESDPEEINQHQQAVEQLQMQVRSEAQEVGYAEGQQKGFAAGQKSGYEVGYQQGLSAAQQQQAPVQARMQQLVAEFQHTLEALDSVIVSRLMQLALEAARQVLGQAPHVDGTALLRQIQTMIQQEPMFSGKPTLRVHPDDLPQVENTLGATLSLHDWRLLADSAIHPGGC